MDEIIEHQWAYDDEKLLDSISAVAGQLILCLRVDLKMKRTQQLFSEGEQSVFS